MRNKILILICTVFLSSSCSVEKGTMSTYDAYVEIYRAIDYKEKECKSKPGYLFYVPENPDEYGVRLCSMSILRMDCPFKEYPTFCWELHGVDLPFIGP